MDKKIFFGGLKGGDIRVKTAAAATGLNILLTAVKFLLIFLSGSMAVLAEAWHSFSDIITSLLVFLALKKPWQRTQEGSEATAEGSGKPAVGKAELLVSLGIGLFLLIVAVTIFKNVFSAHAVLIKLPLVSGFLFLLFSLGSYFIYRLETMVGKKEGSLGLVADGYHARADMTSSLLAGFSLILYAMGLNIDRWIAAVIALFILSFAVETIVNVIIVFYRRDAADLLKYRSFSIIACLFDPAAIRHVLSTLHAFIESKIGEKKLLAAGYKTALLLPAVVAVLAYLSTAFYTVGVNGQAVVERFGKPVDPNTPVGPGLHLKLPWPVDCVRKVQTARIETVNIGNITDSRAQAFLWTRAHGTEEAFLSGDNNFFYPYIVVHYRIKNIFQYLYKNISPETLLTEAGHHAATILFARETFYAIAAAHRSSLENTLLGQLQSELDARECGIQLLEVTFKDIHPPISVSDAFEGVIAGYQEKQKLINDARGYRNGLIPESRGKAEKEREAAQGYIAGRRKKAEGDASRFSLALPETPAAKQVAVSRLRLQTAQNMLRDKTNIVIDPRAGTSDVWMGFDRINPPEGKGAMQ